MVEVGSEVGGRKDGCVVDDALAGWVVGVVVVSNCVVVEGAVNVVEATDEREVVAAVASACVATGKAAAADAAVVADADVADEVVIAVVVELGAEIVDVEGVVEVGEWIVKPVVMS